MARDLLVVGNDLSELRRMSEWLRTRAAAAGISSDLTDRLDVCANEAVTNIISYAFPDAGKHEISIELSRTPQGADLVISDDGQPFNMLDAAAYELPQSLVSARIGGIGIHLIRGLMSQCSYERAGRLNVLRLESRQGRPHDDA